MTTETISLGSVDEADAGKVVNEAEEVVNGPEAENEGLKAENEGLKAENEGLKAENERLKAENERLKAENERLTGISGQVLAAARENVRKSQESAFRFFTDSFQIISQNLREIKLLRGALGLEDNNLLNDEKAEPPKNLPNYKIDFDPNDPLWKTRLRELIQGLEQSTAPRGGTESGPSNFQHSTPTEQTGNLPT